MSRPSIRCAIYTRKSSEEGLEQGFNSLDAQREACEAYVLSQRSQGWVTLATRYDDGGLSGGTLERPAMKALMDDISHGKVDLVVVYKVDRLTRSLADFAKLVELFDQHGVSFVSVTQQFNTTTSMGRLTLNVLLSFAQFEREVTAERIRDKIAASKKKGLWMGGLPPLGYDARDRQLHVNPKEAETVRTIFRLYLELGTVKQVLAEVNRLGLLTKRRRRADGSEWGAQPFTRGHLHQMLVNPIYVGLMRHQGTTYPGQHEAIIEKGTFDLVQERLSANAAKRRSSGNADAPSVLAGHIFDETGDRLCPTHANKKGRRYRYYVSQRLINSSSEGQGGWRLPARELERLVANAIGSFLQDRLRLLDQLPLKQAAPQRVAALLPTAAAIGDDLTSETSGQSEALLRQLVWRVTVSPEALSVDVDRKALLKLLSLGPDDLLPAAVERIEIRERITLKRRGVEAKLIVQSEKDGSREPDSKLLDLLADAHRWLKVLLDEEAPSVRALALSNDMDRADLGRTIQLAFLAPDTVEAILGGMQPIELTPRMLKRLGQLPLDWREQRRMLGFAA